MRHIHDHIIAYPRQNIVFTLQIVAHKLHSVYVLYLMILLEGTITTSRKFYKVRSLFVHGSHDTERNITVK